MRTPGVGQKAASVAFRLAMMAVPLVVYRLVAARGCSQSGNTDALAPRFEVVSVKQSTTTEMRVQANSAPVRFALGGFRYTPGRLTSNLSLSSLIDEAFSVKSWQVSGPSWLGLDKYDLTATMPADTTKATARLMLRRMLADRFGLKFHLERKEFPVYALVPGKSGPRLDAVADPGHWDQKMAPGRFTATAIPIEKFADWLTSIADRPVIDMTGITGVYKLDMQWTPDYQDEPRRWDAGIFDAVKKLGLKLVSRNAPIEFLVVDHVERVPTPN